MMYTGISNQCPQSSNSHGGLFQAEELPNSQDECTSVPVVFQVLHDCRILQRNCLLQQQPYIKLVNETGFSSQMGVSL